MKRRPQSRGASLIAERKPKMEPKDIVARSITLVDSSGRPRVTMSAEAPEGRCSIALHAAGKCGVQIEAGPGDRAVISISSNQVIGALTITSEGVTLRSEDGRLGVVVGRADDGSDDLIVFRDGQIVWRANGANKG